MSLPQSELGRLRAGVGLDAAKFARLVDLTEWQYRSIELGRVKKVSADVQARIVALLPGAKAFFGGRGND